MVFAPLETQTFVPTDEQAFLLFYRPLVKEIYLKERRLTSLDLAREADKGKTLSSQLAIQKLVELMATGIRKSLEELRSQKAAFDRSLIDRDFSSIRYVVLDLADAPTVMCSGIAQPDYDFAGQPIQDVGDLQQPAQFVAFSLMSADGGGAAVFAWPSTSDIAASRLVDSLLNLSKEAIPHALVRFAYSVFENTYASPVWWESLTPAMRDALEVRINHRISFVESVKSAYLVDDGVRAVHWHVEKVRQKR